MGLPAGQAERIPAPGSSGRHLGRLRLRESGPELRTARGLPWRTAYVLRALAAGGPLHPRADLQDSAGELEGRAGSLIEVPPRDPNPSPAPGRVRGAHSQ